MRASRVSHSVCNVPMQFLMVHGSIGALVPLALFVHPIFALAAPVVWMVPLMLCATINANEENAVDNVVDASTAEGPWLEYNMRTMKD